ncbi:hypothetical protein TWF679_007132 [Orbilia oligospora]|uniref:Uncharacterized protein n=1 Tax=Orbilia oligospora TaxID=2813651 RepID=A0A8H8V845_ORBOL|nr:hypothetical protein TWF679_007132 [Orbilia oligospora]
MEQSRKDSQQYPHSILEWLAIDGLYSPHVLKIEISGRRLPNLSIFDFNLGIHSYLHTYIFPKDLDIKLTLSYKYLTNPRAILLMVVEGQKDSEIEEVSNTALQADPGRTRTIGAIKGRVGLGNISGLRNFQRTEISSYRVRRSHHGCSLWSHLNPDNLGVENLKAFIGRLMFEQDKIKRTPLILETEENATNKSTQLRGNETRGYSSGFSGFGQTETGSGPSMQKRGEASHLGSAGDPSSSTVTNNKNKPDSTRTMGLGSRGNGTGNSPTGVTNSNMTLQGQGHNQATSANTNILPGQFDIFFVVHCTDNRAVMKVIRMLVIHRDSDLFQSLRENYNLIRGWRRFFSFTTICDIQWVRFKRYSTKPVSKSDGLCDNIFESLPDRADRDYQIDIREPPKPMIRPISRQHIMELYETPKDLENCNECLRTAMPKWVGSNADTKLKESA